MDVSAVSTPQPHLVPGYTGYVPQFRFRVGKTFGVQSHKLFIDPCVTHGEKLIVADSVCGDGKSKIHNLRKSCEDFETELTGRLVIDCREPIKAIDEPVKESPYHFSLFVLRPEFAAKDTVTPSQLPKISNDLKEHSQKRRRRGYIGRQPFSWPQFGQPQHQHSTASCSSLDFAKSQQHRRSTEWAPIGSAGVGMLRPATAVVHGYHSPAIYHTSTGMLPTYQGHVPGHLFSYGQTYGTSSRDAKKWLSANCHY